jgi:hypothetical protein
MTDGLTGKIGNGEIEMSAPLKIFNFTFHAGFPLSFTIVAESIEVALPDAYKLCEKIVGSGFKAKALDGQYLKSVVVTQIDKTIFLKGEIND